MNFEQLDTLMLRPDSYPHPVDLPIRKVETHISAVYLTGTYAYKVKKPVNFGFVDFSTLEKRAHFCQQELMLNRRFAPELYLEVVSITPEGVQAEGLPHFLKNKNLNAQKNLEFAVKMRQFDPNCVLSHLFEQNKPLTEQQLQQLAQHLAQFHLQAAPVTDQAPWGWPDKVAQPMFENFPVLYQQFPQWHERLHKLETWTRHTLIQHRALLAKRRYKGFIRACHGDLHLDNIALINHRAIPFDGIEFNEQFRWIDPISDLAFLYMDLVFRGHENMAQHLLLQWLHATQDTEALKLLAFYLVYRALVRAKITTLRGQQLRSEARTQLFETVERYIALAESFSQRHTPFLILMQGISGSGKSYYAHMLSKQLGAIVISSDRERKRLAGLPATQRPDETLKPQLYSAEMNRKTYSRLHTLAQAFLEAGWPVILDATFLKQAHRRAALALAGKLPALVFSIQTDMNTCKTQIQKRRQLNNDPSDVDETVMLHQWQFMEPPDAHHEPVFFQPAGTPIDWRALKMRLNLPTKEA